MPKHRSVSINRELALPQPLRAGRCGRSLREAEETHLEEFVTGTKIFVTGTKVLVWHTPLWLTWHHSSRAFLQFDLVQKLHSVKDYGWELASTNTESIGEQISNIWRWHANFADALPLWLGSQMQWFALKCHKNISVSFVPKDALDKRGSGEQSIGMEIGEPQICSVLMKKPGNESSAGRQL